MFTHAWHGSAATLAAAASRVNVLRNKEKNVDFCCSVFNLLCFYGIEID